MDKVNEYEIHYGSVSEEEYNKLNLVVFDEKMPTWRDRIYLRRYKKKFSNEPLTAFWIAKIKRRPKYVLLDFWYFILDFFLRMIGR